MNKTVISVIVPVYNVQDYLDECVDSIVSQTYRELQVLLVDDGSTDNSGRLCDEWATKDARVMTVHQQNGGLSDARNTGIAHATGDYLMFIDSDDFLEDTEAIGRLVARLESTSPDVLHFVYQKYNDETGEKTPYVVNPPVMPDDLSKEEQLSFLTANGLYIASACNKLVSRVLFDGDELRFRKGVFSEDIEWCAKLMVCAGKMDFVNEPCYCYRQRTSSITHTVSDKKCTDLCDNILRVFDIIAAAPTSVRAALSRYAAYQYATFFAVQAMAQNAQTNNIRRLKPHSAILSRHGGNKKVKALNLACKVMGYENTCRLVRRLYQKKRSA